MLKPAASAESTVALNPVRARVAVTAMARSRRTLKEVLETLVESYNMDAAVTLIRAI